MRRLSGEDGQVIIVVALFMTVLLGMGALAVDVGALFVRKHQLQTGADAAAIAIAKQCVGAFVDGQPGQCNDDEAESTSISYFNTNTAVTPIVADPDLDVFEGGRAGRITVTASYEEPPIFSWAISDGGPVNVAATATARWGPLTSADDVFPLAVCQGALPEPGVDVTLWSAPSGDEMLGECDGAPTALPLGWLTPSDPDACTADVTLLPRMDLDVGPSDTPPAASGCTNAIGELLDDLDGVGATENPIRVLAVYEASPSIGPYPVSSLIAFEFTGARLGGREEHGGSDWSSSDSICRSDSTYPLEDLQCIRGRVTNYEPPQGGPILDLSQLLNPGIIDDTTVLDVRLVD